jgi:hypothetical protein
MHCDCLYVIFNLVYYPDDDGESSLKHFGNESPVMYTFHIRAYVGFIRFIH